MKTRIELLATLVALSAGTAACAVDGPDADPAVPTPVAGGQHCVVESTGEVNCYDSFRESIAAATNGEVADAPEDSAAAMADPSLDARINAIELRHRADRLGPVITAGSTTNVDVVVGITYWDANYGGQSWVWKYPTGCDGNTTTVDYQRYNLNDGNLQPVNDQISSFHSYSFCQTILYEDWFYEGLKTNGGLPIADESYVGNYINDKASSIQWF